MNKGEQMKCYKGFDKNLKCRGFQYEVGGEYAEESANICNKGFHACESPLEVFSYYPPGEQSRYCAVELDANDQRSDDSKRVGKHIKIDAEIGIAGLVKAHFEYVHKNVKESVEKGDSEAATAGYKGAATSRGKSASGKNGLSVARGNDVKAKGGVGAVLVIVEEQSNSYDIKEWKTAVVDGENIKPDVWYRLKDGEFVEVEE